MSELLGSFGYLQTQRCPYSLRNNRSRTGPLVLAGLGYNSSRTTAFLLQTGFQGIWRFQGIEGFQRIWGFGSWPLILFQSLDLTHLCEIL